MDAKWDEKRDENVGAKGDEKMDAKVDAKLVETK